LKTLSLSKERQALENSKRKEELAKKASSSLSLKGRCMMELSPVLERIKTTAEKDRLIVAKWHNNLIMIQTDEKTDFHLFVGFDKVYKDYDRSKEPYTRLHWKGKYYENKECLEPLEELNLPHLQIALKEFLKEG
jgi:hypothetical protein